MTITPRFELSQTEKDVIINIHVPHIRIIGNTSLECHIYPEPIGNEFYFYCQPYLLHLVFPHNLKNNVTHETEEIKAKYDPNDRHGTLIIKVPKETPNLYFPDLDMMTRLLQKRNTKNETTILGDLRPKYGFAYQYYDMFQTIMEEERAMECFELSDPDNTEENQRTIIRLETEKKKFDPEQYLLDNIPKNCDLEQEDDYILQQAMEMIPFWESFTSNDIVKNENNDMTSIQRQLANTTINNDSSCWKSNSSLNFTQEERNQLTQIPNIDIPQSMLTFHNDDIKRSSILLELESNSFKHPDIMIKSHLCSLLDILYAYAYDHRTTDGESTCESAWTISILSPTLSWFENYKYILEHSTSQPTNSEEGIHFIPLLLQNSIRRTFIYPLIRNHSLAQHIVKYDIPKILSHGRRGILKCLLKIHSIMEHSDIYYWNNKLYINGMCVWIQALKDTIIDEFYQIYQKQIINTTENHLGKEHLDLNLIHLEHKYYYTDRDNQFDTDDEESISSANYSSANYTTDDSDDTDDDSKDSSDDDSKDSTNGKNDIKNEPFTKKSNTSDTLLKLESLSVTDVNTSNLEDNEMDFMESKNKKTLIQEIN